MRIDNTSPLYQVKHWRNANQNVEQALQDFIFYLRFDHEDDIPESTIKDIQALIDSFLGFDKQKIMQGELSMLAQWNKSVIDTESK